nr:ATP-binding protein [Sphingomonas jejuensis]
MPRVRSLPSWLRWLAAALILAILAAVAAAHIAERRAVSAIAAAARSDAALRTALLDSEVARLRLLPRALAEDRDVLGALAGQGPARAALNRKLETLATDTGAAVLYVIGRDGVAIASSNWRTPQSFVGTDYDFRSYVREARARGEATEFAVGTVSRRPGLYFARRNSDGGIVVVKLEFGGIERAWARAGGTSIVTDAAGVVMVTSAPAWRFATTRPLSPTAMAVVRDAALLGDRPLPALPFDGDRLAGVRVIGASAPAQLPGWTLTLFRPVGPALVAGRVAALVTALSVLGLLALVWVVRERARLGRRRTAELEQAVGARTAELAREMDERAAVEARAAELREGLRQANRLATLGQVTASVAHETAQPVAAIRTYAETSRLLLERGDTAAVVANLAAIGRLTDRVGAVTTELRGFARRRAGDLRAVPLADVVEGAMLILKEQLRAVTLDVAPIDPALAVTGGRVRLEQVLVNLMQNAIEAMAATPHPVLTLSTVVAADVVRLTVADTGPGIPAHIAERLFTPFVTSRDSGLGLGLVIAHDIMIDLGGTLRQLPSAEGAVFEITMRRA